MLQRFDEIDSNDNAQLSEEEIINSMNSLKNPNQDRTGVDSHKNKIDDGSILGSFENEEDSWIEKGSAGIIKLYNNDGNLIWTYDSSNDSYC